MGQKDKDLGFIPFPEGWEVVGKIPAETVRKGLGPNLSTVDRELAKLFRGAKYPQTNYPHRSPSGGPLVGNYLGVDTSPGDVKKLGGLVNEYGRIIPGVVSSLQAVLMKSMPPIPPPNVIMGDFDPHPRFIGINPDLTNINRWYPHDLEATFAHELGHAGGYPHNRHLYNIEGVGRMRGEYKEQFKKGIR